MVECSHSDQQFTQNASLWTHKKFVHEGVKYSCDQCEYQAGQKDNLKAHKRTKH